MLSSWQSAKLKHEINPSIFSDDLIDLYAHSIYLSIYDTHPK